MCLFWYWIYYRYLGNISPNFCLQSASRSNVNAYVNVFQRYVYNVLKVSHSFTCTPRVHPITEWTMPACAFPAEDGTHLLTPEGWKVELALCGLQSIGVYDKIPLYSWFVVIAISLVLVYNVCVGCLLTSQTLALRLSWLYFTVEWICGVKTTLYHARHPLLAQAVGVRRRNKSWSNLERLSLMAPCVLHTSIKFEVSIAFLSEWHCS